MAEIDDVVSEHVRALFAHDIEGFVESYADDAVVFGGPFPIQGKDTIRTAFETMLEMLPIDALPPDIEFEVRVSSGEYAFVTYSHEGIHGGDTFHVRDGKIIMQAAHLVFDTPPT